ncbi:MAG: SUMF1/EgtB/PvdO family nonheme iron enzyme [Pseudomonadota bacterium]
MRLPLVMALLPLLASADGVSPLDLPAEARFGLLTSSADGDMDRALDRCRHGDHRFEPTPDRFPHATPPGSYYLDLGFIAPSELHPPLRDPLLALVPQRRGCAMVELPSGPVIAMLMMGSDATAADATDLAIFEARRGARAARRGLTERLAAEGAARGGGATGGTPGEAVVLPGGVAWLGSTEADIDLRVTLFERYIAPHVGPAKRVWYEDEIRRPVQVGPLALDRAEVTVVRFRAFAESTGYRADPRSVEASLDPALPVVFVDGADARAYCAWVGGRMPTADEWEVAARGTAGRRYAWGDAPPDGSRANFCDLRCARPYGTPDHDDGFAGLAPVGSYPAGATPEGLLDMGGNAREWTSTPADGERLMVRGGGYQNAYDDLTAADVRANRWDERQPDIGFRCAYDLD